MPLSAADLKNLIVLEVGDIGGLVDSQVEVIWDKYDDIADLILHGLYVKRDAIDLLRGAVWKEVTQSGTPATDGQLNLSDKYKALSTMWDDVDTQIVRRTATSAETTQQGSDGLSFVPATFGGAPATDEYSRGTGFWR